jgi:hypothetical protein
LSAHGLHVPRRELVRPRQRRSRLLSSAWSNGHLYGCKFGHGGLPRVCLTAPPVRHPRPQAALQTRMAQMSGSGAALASNQVSTILSIAPTRSKRCGNLGVQIERCIDDARLATCNKAEVVASHHEWVVSVTSMLPKASLLSHQSNGVNAASLLDRYDALTYAQEHPTQRAVFR